MVSQIYIFLCFMVYLLCLATKVEKNMSAIKPFGLATMRSLHHNEGEKYDR